MIEDMFGKLLLMVLLLAALGLSVRQRMVLLKRRNPFDQLPDVPISTFLSEALAQLVGVAGGLYLSLIMLVSFLELELPDRITVMGLTMQPLALVALTLAILQPLVKSVIDKVMR